MPTVPVIADHTAAADSANRINPSWTLPATINAGDLVVIFVGNGAGGTISAGPAGFTRLETIGLTTVNFQECWAKVCDGTEDGATVTFTSGNSRPWVSDIFRVTGGPSALTSLLHGSASTTAGTAPASVSVDTITDNNLVIQAVRSGSASAAPLTAPAGWTKEDEATNGGGTAPGSITSAFKTQTPLGATGAGAWTTSASTTYTRITVAIPAGAANAIPTAIVGPDQCVAPGSTVTLAGSGTDPDGTIVGYAWTCTAAYGDGTSVSAPVLSSATAQNPTFTAPATEGVYVFSLVVTDNSGGISTNVTHCAVIVDAAAGAGVFPRVSGAWDATSTLAARIDGIWQNVTV